VPSARTLASAANRASRHGPTDALAGPVFRASDQELELAQLSHVAVRELVEEDRLAVPEAHTPARAIGRLLVNVVRDEPVASATTPASRTRTSATPAVARPG
jgi:hypothetical protein